MKDKIITIKPKNITQKQWSVLLLELNMIKNAWRPYGVNIEMSAPGLKRIVEWGTKKYGTDHSKWWFVSSSANNKTDDGRHSFG